MNAEVFISYAAKDRDRVAKLVEGLQRAGVSVWIDMAGIEVAAMWSKEIVSAIRECKVLLLSISPQSTESENVVKELALASERKKTIIPIYLEPAEIPETMEYQLAGIQRVEFYEGREEVALRAVIRALAKLGVTVADEASAAAAGAPNMASHGVRHSSAGQAPKSEGSAWGKIAATVIGLAVLAVGMFLLGGSGQAPAPGKPSLGQAEKNAVEETQPLAKLVTLDTNRVVVLPFKVIGATKESEDLGYGLVSTLTSKLQPLDNLTVIANESALKFKDSEQSPNEIGQTLQVGTIVTGEIQTSGDKVQVNIRVIDANTAALGWGNTFTKPKDDFLDLQNEIATKLASELKGGLAAVESQQLATKATENPEAQAQYQAGRREWNKRSKEGFENAIKHFERAIELDPNYADPYVGLGDTYGLLPGYNFALASEAMPKAKIYAEKAIELNPILASPYTLIGWVRSRYEYDWVGAEESYKKAISLNSNYATSFHWYGIHLRESGRFIEAMENLSRANQLEPTSKIIKVNLALAFGYANEAESAVKTIDEALEIDPHFPRALEIKYIRLRSDEHESLDRFKAALKVYPNQPGINQCLFESYWRLGESEKAKEQLIFLLSRYSESFPKAVFAKLFYLMGEKDEALRWLTMAFEYNETQVLSIGVDPNYSEFQSEPQFREMYKKINHPMYVDE